MPLFLLAGSMLGILEAANAMKKRFVAKDQSSQSANYQASSLSPTLGDRVTGRRLAAF